MQKLLIIGGPNFIGRVLLEKLSESKRFEVTMFNRGITNPQLFPEVKRIKGDRNTADVAQIGQEHWDYVVDVACFLPGNFPNLLKHINVDVKRYIFISTVSVYEEHEGSNYAEDAPTLAYHTAEDVDQPLGSPTLYGPRKAECERILQSSGLNHTILRPAIIYGSYDWTDRLSYWLHQVRHREKIFLPEAGRNRMAYTYVHDLVSSIIALLSPMQAAPVYNSITTDLSLAEVVSLAQTALNKNVGVVNAPKAFLDNEGLQYWSDLPLWLSHDALWDRTRFSADFGQYFTPIAQTIKETMDYYESIQWPEPAFRKLKDEGYAGVLKRLGKG